MGKNTVVKSDIPVVTFDCPNCGEMLETSMDDFELQPSMLKPKFVLTGAECVKCGDELDVVMSPTEW